MWIRRLRLGEKGFKGTPQVGNKTRTGPLVSKPEPYTVPKVPQGNSLPCFPAPVHPGRGWESLDKLGLDPGLLATECVTSAFTTAVIAEENHKTEFIGETVKT